MGFKNCRRVVRRQKFRQPLKLVARIYIPHAREWFWTLTVLKWKLIAFDANDFVSKMR